MKKCKHYFFKIKGIILFSLMLMFFLLCSCSSSTPPKKDDPNGSPPRRQQKPINPEYGPRPGIIIEKKSIN
jgi:hypothetical protein